MGTIRNRKRWVASLTSSVVVLAGTAGMAGVITATPASAASPYKIYLSNTDLDNGWRLEMQSIAQNFVADRPVQP